MRKIARRLHFERSDVTNPTPSAPFVLSEREFERDFRVWSESVDVATSRRASLERLILAKGIVRPIAMVQRFFRKSAEVGVFGAVAIVGQRLRARLRGRAS